MILYSISDTRNESILIFSHHDSSSKQPLPDDDVMMEDMINDREDEKTFMKFFDQFQGLSMEEVMACKAVRTSVSRPGIDSSTCTMSHRRKQTNLISLLSHWHLLPHYADASTYRNLYLQNGACCKQLAPQSRILLATTVPQLIS